MSGADNSTNAPPQDGTNAAHGEMLSLPAPGDAPTHTLDVNSDSGVRLDELGPIVVNSDGTLSRVPNWHDMAPIEQERTIRLLSKRNKQRMESLRGQN
ncbi:hypothetical protein MCUN1_003099 [Malassezia cuniculi]|uniref:Uncharacterized protein n=1 Tax=Malassezia cuniculi TaxID=948313 RepID=A0AAF0EXQ6_9BASI|nr:hypothetical protein MCUN1_003099 [Malassezia cuniculi]